MNDLFNLPILSFVFAETESTMAHDTEVLTAIPEIWANKFLQAIFTKSALITAVNRQFENEVATEGDTVNIQVNGKFTTTDKVANTKCVPQNPALTDKTVKLENHKYVQFFLEDRAGSLAVNGVMGSYLNDAVAAIVNDVEASIGAEYINAGSNVEWDATSAATKLASILAARTVIRVDEKCPMDIPTYLILRDLADILTVDQFTSSDNISGRPLETAQVGSIVDFVIKESGGIEYSVSPTNTNRMCFARDAIALISRPCALPIAGIGAQGCVVQKDGLGVRVVMGYSMEYMASICNVDLLWGVKTIKPAWLVNLSEI